MSKIWSPKKKYANFEWELDGIRWSSSVCPRQTVKSFVAGTAKERNVFPSRIRVLPATKLLTMKELESYLEQAGFDVVLVGGQCPFQIEANHRDGFSIYFRSRHECASLEVYDCHYDYFSGLPDDDQLLWEDEFCCWDEPDAGYLDFDEAFYVFHSLWTEARGALDISPTCHILDK